MNQPNKELIIIPNKDFLINSKAGYDILIDEYWLAYKFNKIQSFWRIYHPPQPGDEMVSLGSSVTVNSKNDQYTVNIMGLPDILPPIIEESDNVKPTTEIAKAILGKKIGQMAVIASSQMSIEIIKIDQTIITQELKNKFSQQ